MSDLGGPEVRPPNAALRGPALGVSKAESTPFLNCFAVLIFIFAFLSLECE